MLYPFFVGNKTKGRISKRVFQENKARQIFRKTNISYPLKYPGLILEKRGRLRYIEKGTIFLKGHLIFFPIQLGCIWGSPRRFFEISAILNAQ